VKPQKEKMGQFSNGLFSYQIIKRLEKSLVKTGFHPRVIKSINSIHGDKKHVGCIFTPKALLT
jgi:hypothetical protein